MLDVTYVTTNAELFSYLHIHLSDPVGTVWDFGCPSSGVGLGRL